ncbi:MAG TPA: hypothetical protein VHJ20_20615 [Polyangia bacterium]|nr:hypothetical protein [Polyangia bacterium]
MSAGRAVVVATLVISVGLGGYSFLAMKHTAGRRAALVDEVAAEMPAFPGGRIIAPWEPATYADDVRAMYCLDDADPEGGAGRVLNALLAAGWTKTETKRDPAAGTVVMSFAGPIRLRAGLSKGARTDCDGAKRQVTVAFDGTR